MRRVLVSCVLALGLTGCASKRLAGPAGTMSTDVSSLSASLSRLQDDLTDYAGTVQSRTDGTTARSDAVHAAALQRQVEWQLLDAPTPLDALHALFAQAQTEANRLSIPGPAAAPPPKIELPVKALANVAKGLNGVAKGRSDREELSALVDYAKRINTQLSTVDGKAGAPSAAK